jgi:hypothetical protein
MANSAINKALAYFDKKSTLDVLAGDELAEFMQAFSILSTSTSLHAIQIVNTSTSPVQKAQPKQSKIGNLSEEISEGKAKILDKFKSRIS